MTNQARFLLHFPSAKDACVVSQSLSPEIQHKIPKAAVTFSVDKKTLVVIIESEDVSSLRAACNSYLRWISTALAVKQLV
jgi:tRNA threonylcarbamoyladenosine modification (KEOPS) complex  Pcc1 subunit